MISPCVLLKSLFNPSLPVSTGDVEIYASLGSEGGDEAAEESLSGAEFFPWIHRWETTMGIRKWGGFL